jgi:hypothetical protein
MQPLTQHRTNVTSTPASRAIGFVASLLWWACMAFAVYIAYRHFEAPIPEPTALKSSIELLEKTRTQLAKESAMAARRVQWLKDPNDPSFMLLQGTERHNLQPDDAVILRVPEQK